MWIFVWAEQGTPHSHCDGNIHSSPCHKWHAATWLCVSLFPPWVLMPLPLYADPVTDSAQVCLCGRCVLYMREGKPVCFVRAGDANLCKNSPILTTALPNLPCANGPVVWVCVCVVPQGLAYSQYHAQDMSHRQERMCSALRYPRHTITQSQHWAKSRLKHTAIPLTSQALEHRQHIWVGFKW